MTYPHRQDLKDKATMLQAHALACYRQDQSLFHPVSFTLTAGSGLWVKGPNGIGKSSLLRLIAGISTSETGELYWNDHLVERDRAAYTEQLHYLGHADGLRTGLTVMENIQLAAVLAQQPLQNLDATLSQLQLHAIRYKQIQHLSAGQKRRAALARFFLIPRALWILDEPLTALDAHTQAVVFANIHTHLQQGGLCILTSHHDLPLPIFEQLELAAC